MCVVLALSVLVVVCFVFKRIRRKSQNENKQRGNIILRTQIRLLTALCKILCICHKILHRYIHLMCMATKAYLLGRTLCNTSNRSLKVYTFESERLFDIEYSLKLFRQNKNHRSPHILFKLIFFL